MHPRKLAARGMVTGFFAPRRYGAKGKASLHFRTKARSQ
jgi:hypothetical protein